MPISPTPKTPDPFDVAGLTCLPDVAYGRLVAIIPVGLTVRWVSESPTVTLYVSASLAVVLVLAMILAGLWPCPFCGSPFQYRIGDRFLVIREPVVPGRTRFVNCDRSIEMSDGAPGDQTLQTEDQNRER